MAERNGRPSSALFDVYLRLRPSPVPCAERFLDVEETQAGDHPTHITIKPPANDHRKRAIEKFQFTRVFEEEASQLELFKSTGVPAIIEAVLGRDKSQGRDGLVATLGVTGSGKSHTILGSRSQRGLTQLSLDTLFQTIEKRTIDAADDEELLQSLSLSDVCESQMMSASTFLELAYGDNTTSSRMSRATTRATTPLMETSFMSIPGASSKKYLPRLSTMPQSPSINDVRIDCDTSSEYAVAISMYEVYNDRIFDLLAGSSKTPIQKRRGLLFKSTELSPDRKVVAGLRKVICASLDEALLVLETGLIERRVAGTGSNAVSSRSHGFFCVEIKKRPERSPSCAWKSSNLTIVDLAGSERARVAKTTGSTLAEAGKINESLMYLGQCMQLQSDNADLSKPLSIVPFRQCKLTELLFSNSFPSTTSNNPSTSLRHHPHLSNGAARRSPQKSIMIVTADPLGDFNATSQILRYSALAREVTVPRIPSVTSTLGMRPSSRSASPSEDLDAALAEITRLRADLDILTVRYESEQARRREAEASWSAAAERADAVEAETRDEMWGEFEVRLAQEMRRWRAAAEEESEANEARMDRKLDILARGIEVHEDPDEGRVAELEQENERLRARVEELTRENGMRSPSKKMRVLKSRKWEGSGVGFEGSP